MSKRDSYSRVLSALVVEANRGVGSKLTAPHRPAVRDGPRLRLRRAPAPLRF